MKLRTSNELQDALDGELAWRLQEISHVKGSVFTSNNLAERTLIRAGVPLLYAHWEGFVKASAESLLNFVAHQNKKYKELQLCYAVHSFSRYIDSAKASQKTRSRLDALQFVLSQLDKRASFAWKGKVNTRANLNSEVFEDIACAIGINTARYTPRYPLIDESLLKARNRIAHGEFLEIQKDPFLKLADETVTLIRWFKTDIENVVATNSYLAEKV